MFDDTPVIIENDSTDDKISTISSSIIIMVAKSDVGLVILISYQYQNLNIRSRVRSVTSADCSTDLSSTLRQFMPPLIETLTRVMEGVSITGAEAASGARGNNRLASM